MGVLTERLSALERSLATNRVDPAARKLAEGVLRELKACWIAAPRLESWIRNPRETVSDSLLSEIDEIRRGIGGKI